MWLLLRHLVGIKTPAPEGGGNRITEPSVQQEELVTRFVQGIPIEGKPKVRKPALHRFAVELECRRSLARQAKQASYDYPPTITEYTLP